VSSLGVGTYHKGKLYIPVEVREALGLEDGDKLEIRLTSSRSFEAKLKRKTADEKLLEILEKPAKIGVPHLSRREIYEDTR